MVELRRRQIGIYSVVYLTVARGLREEVGEANTGYERTPQDPQSLPALLLSVDEVKDGFDLLLQHCYRARPGHE
jgi:hypothetical protein